MEVGRWPSTRRLCTYGHDRRLPQPSLTPAPSTRACGAPLDGRGENRLARGGSGQGGGLAGENHHSPHVPAPPARVPLAVVGGTPTRVVLLVFFSQPRTQFSDSVWKRIPSHPSTPEAWRHERRPPPPPPSPPPPVPAPSPFSLAVGSCGATYPPPPALVIPRSGPLCLAPGFLSAPDAPLLRTSRPVGGPARPALPLPSLWSPPTRRRHPPRALGAHRLPIPSANTPIPCGPSLVPPRRTACWLDRAALACVMSPPPPPNSPSPPKRYALPV